MSTCPVVKGCGQPGDSCTLQPPQEGASGARGAHHEHSRNSHTGLGTLIPRSTCLAILIWRHAPGNLRAPLCKQRKLGFTTYGDLPWDLQGSISISRESSHRSWNGGMRQGKTPAPHARTCTGSMLTHASHGVMGWHRFQQGCSGGCGTQRICSTLYLHVRPTADPCLLMKRGGTGHWNLLSPTLPQASLQKCKSQVVFTRCFTSPIQGPCNQNVISNFVNATHTRTYLILLRRGS